MLCAFYRETKCEGITLLRRILSDQRETINEFHSVVGAILTEVKNLRSQVTRNALNCIGDVFAYSPKSCEVVSICSCVFCVFVQRLV